MSGAELYSPAADFRPMVERVDACATVLYVHGYITQKERERIAVKLNKEIARAEKSA